MKKILQVCNTDLYLSKFLLPLVCELQAKGFHVECICNGKNYDKKLDELGIKVHQFKFPQSVNPFQFISAIKTMKQFLQDHDFDMVNSHSRNASIVTRVAAWQAKVLINLYTAHGFYFSDDQNFIVNKITEVLEGWLAKITTHTLSQSNEDVRRMIDAGWLQANQIQFIGNGIKIDKFTSTKSKEEYCKGLGLENIFRVVAVAQKGNQSSALIKGFYHFQKKFPHSELVLVGNNTAFNMDSVLNSFQPLISKLDIQKKVKIIGLVENIEDYIGASDVFVISPYREGMPTALLEAMCMGKPVLAANVRGCRELINHKQDGLLFEAKKHEQISDYLEVLFNNSFKAKQYGELARKKVLNQYTERDYTLKQVAIIEDLFTQHATKAKI